MAKTELHLITQKTHEFLICYLLLSPNTHISDSENQILSGSLEASNRNAFRVLTESKPCINTAIVLCF